MNERFDDERLLEWILNPDDQDHAARARSDGPDGPDGLDADGHRRVGELTSFLERCRDLAAEVDQVSTEDARPLAQGVLARTTREDLSWRGDLALVGQYLRERVEASGWVKLAAASLLVHMIALPALAYYVFVARSQGPEIEFIPWEEYYPDGFLEREELPTPELTYPEGDGDELDSVLPGEDR